MRGLLEEPSDEFAGTLSALTDVSIVSPENHQDLEYNSVTSKWENKDTLYTPDGLNFYNSYYMRNNGFNVVQFSVGHSGAFDVNSLDNVLGSNDFQIDASGYTVGLGDTSTFYIYSRYGKTIQVDNTSVDIYDPGTLVSSVHIQGGYQAYGDYTNMSTGSFFDFDQATNIYTFWASPTSRAFQIDLQGLSCLIGDPDAILVNGFYASVDPGGLGPTGVAGFSIGVGLGSGTFDPYGAFDTLGLSLLKSGMGVSIKEGSNATSGTATLSGGTVTVSNTTVTATSRFNVTSRGGTNIGNYWVTVIAGTSFTINSSNGADANTVDWFFVQGI